MELGEPTCYAALHYCSATAGSRGARAGLRWLRAANVPLSANQGQSPLLKEHPCMTSMEVQSTPMFNETHLTNLAITKKADKSAMKILDVAFGDAVRSERTFAAA